MLAPLPRCRTTVRPAAAFASCCGRMEAMYSVRQPVKPVSPHAGLVQLVGKREALRNRRLALVKRRVEAGDLRQLRPALKEQPDRLQVIGLMERREWVVFLERSHNACIDPDRLRVFDPAVHHAVPHAEQPVLGKLAAKKAGKMVDCTLMAELRARIPLFLAHGCARRALRDEMRAGVEPLDLAAQRERGGARALDEHRKLYGGGPRVDDQYRVRHRASSPPGRPARAAPSPATPPRRRKRAASSPSPPGSSV